MRHEIGLKSREDSLRGNPKRGIRVELRVATAELSLPRCCDRSRNLVQVGRIETLQEARRQLSACRS